MPARYVGQSYTSKRKAAAGVRSSPGSRGRKKRLDTRAPALVLGRLCYR